MLVVGGDCLQGHAGRDASTNAFLNDIVAQVHPPLARRAARLCRQARRGSTVDALLVASAEPGGTVLTSDIEDLDALAQYSQAVLIERI